MHLAQESDMLGYTLFRGDLGFGLLLLDLEAFCNQGESRTRRARSFCILSCIAVSLPFFLPNDVKYAQ